MDDEKFLEWGDDDGGFDKATDLLREAYRRGWQDAIEMMQEKLKQGEAKWQD
jgi:hypothetical protein